MVRSHFDVGRIAFGAAQGFAVFADPMFAKVLQPVRQLAAPRGACPAHKDSGRVAHQAVDNAAQHLGGGQAMFS